MCRGRFDRGFFHDLKWNRKGGMIMKIPMLIWKLPLLLLLTVSQGYLLTSSLLITLLSRVSVKEWLWEPLALCYQIRVNGSLEEPGHRSCQGHDGSCSSLILPAGEPCRISPLTFVFQPEVQLKFPRWPCFLLPPHLPHSHFLGCLRALCTNLCSPIL